QQELSEHLACRGLHRDRVVTSGWQQMAQAKPGGASLGREHSMASKLSTCAVAHTGEGMFGRSNQRELIAIPPQHISADVQVSTRAQRKLYHAIEQIFHEDWAGRCAGGEWHARMLPQEALDEPRQEILTARGIGAKTQLTEPTPRDALHRDAALRSK